MTDIFDQWIINNVSDDTKWTIIIIAVLVVGFFALITWTREHDREVEERRRNKK